MKIGALSFTYRYYKNDIDSFNLCIGDEEINGKGFLSLLAFLSQKKLNEELIIYVKDMQVFYILSRNFICYDDAKGTYHRDKGNKIFWLKTNNIEFRSWDNFIPNGVEITEPKAFVSYIKKTKDWFGGSIKYWNYTLANRAKSYLTSHYYLYKNNDYKNIHKLNETEYTLYSRIKKGGFYWANPFYNGKTVENVYQFDASSNHISQMARKKFPKESLHLISFEEFTKIVNDDNWCWAAEITFSGYTKLTDLEFDLTSYGMEYNRETKRFSFCIVNPMKTIFKLFKFTDLKFQTIMAAKADYLPNNYYSMIKDLYQNKEESKAKNQIYAALSKFITELPYGLSIRTQEYHWDYEFSSEKNDFIRMPHEFDFEEINRKLSHQPLPIHLGLWTLAYSNSDLINLVLRIEPSNVVYCDTDCVKFVGEENLAIIEEHNNSIDQEFAVIDNNIQFTFPKKLGRWKNEGLAIKFKAIGVKWYLTQNENNEINVKAAGANTKVLKNYLVQSNDPFNEFDTSLSIDNLFISYIANKEKGWIENKSYQDVYDYITNS